MAAETTHSHAPGDIVCPDPSVHEKNNKLSEQASSAALHVTRPASKENPLGSDGKLSSRSAATSLKYAQAQDLPSFPSRGINPSAANAAAMLAKDHKMKDLWQPEMSQAGSVAALKAHKDGGKLDLWQSSPSDAGHSAATLAMKNKSLSPNIDRGYTDTGRSNSLMAATISAQKGRQRSDSTPVVQPAAYPDSHNSNRNALNAASVSHRTSARPATDGWDSEANQAARIQNSHMGKEMFGEHPPVKPEVDEQRHQAALRASAVSMAKQIMDYQNRAPTPSDNGSGVGSAGAETAHRRNQSSTSQADIKQEAIRYINLQDAAHKLAQEKLAKVDKEMEHGRYREYYGYPDQSPKKSRLSTRGRTRARASSEGQHYDDSDDEEQARRIRTQMSQLSTGVNTIDNRQRQEDRARLMAAAEKRVHARMHDMDEKVFAETGKVPQSMMDEWEAKAREKAEKERVERDSNPGKTHIGGGKYMDRAEIEAIAAARLKPTLDEINDTAEKKRARDEEFRRERDAQETQKMEEKMKHQEQKAEFKRIKDHDKALAKKEKEDRKAAQRQEKEDARIRKSEDKRKSREMKRDTTGVAPGGAVAGGVVGAAAADDEDEDKLSDDEVREEGDQETHEPTTEKSGRGMFDRIVSRLKRAGQDEKHAEEPKEVTEEKHDEGSAVPVVPVVAATDAGIAGVVVYEEAQASDHPETSARILNPGDPDYPIQSIGQESHIGADTTTTRVGDYYVSDKAVGEPDERVVVPGVATVGTGTAAAGGVDDEHDELYSDDTADHYKQAETVPNVAVIGSSNRNMPGAFETHPDNEDDKRDPARAAAALAGVATVGAGIAAAVPFSRSRGEEEEEQREISSLSTYDSDKDEDDDEDLTRAVTTPEHSGDHNFATSSLAVPKQKRPDIERHISTIETSEDDSEALDDSDEGDDYFIGEARPVQVADRERVIGQQVETAPVSGMPATRDYDHQAEAAPASAVSATHETPVTQEMPMTQDTSAPQQRPASQIYPMQSRPAAITTAAAAVPVIDSAPPATKEVDTRPTAIDPIETTPSGLDPVDTAPAAIARSPVSPLQSDEEGNIIVFREGAPVDAPHLSIGRGSAPVESGAPAPAVKTGPSTEEPAPAQSEKEHRGVRGLFSKLKNRQSKPHNVLHKKEHQKPSSVISDGQSEKSFKGLEKPTQTIEKDDNITPVTRTAAGNVEEDGDPIEHTAPEEDIGTGQGVGGIEKAAQKARTDSPSSFRRHDEDLNDPDDVSSSGVEEEDVALGRRGRLAKKLGFSKGKGEEKATGKADAVDPYVSDTNGEDEQFEEARDHFDESLAPPPAFAGQMKSESPVRETKFQEQL